jgi:malate dehydrogenase
MTRLDHNRAMSQMAAKTGTHVNDVKRMIIWGNHSSTQYPDIHHCTVNGKPATELVEQTWYHLDFIPAVQQRGAAIIKARGASSAASAASAAIDHMRTWVLGTTKDDWTSMGIPADGSYGIDEGILYSYPVTCNGGDYQIVEGLEIDDFSREKMVITEQELRDERAAISDML